MAHAPTWWSSSTTRHLSVTGEIVLPPKHANTLPTYFNIGYSTDSRFLYVAYVTPASSFGVLDPAKKSVLGEIDTAGCVLVIPSGTQSRLVHLRERTTADRDARCRWS